MIQLCSISLCNILHIYVLYLDTVEKSFTQQSLSLFALAVCTS